MTRFLHALVAVVTISGSAALAETLINIEQAAEVTRLQLRLDAAGNSRIYARICDDCEMLTLRADNDTLIKRGATRLTLEQAAGLRDKGATVLFDPATRQVTRIIFWN